MVSILIFPLLLTTNVNCYYPNAAKRNPEDSRSRYIYKFKHIKFDLKVCDDGT
jgi:hypothetical protein